MSADPMHLPSGQLLEFGPRPPMLPAPVTQRAAVPDRTVKETLRDLCTSLNLEHGELWRWNDEDEVYVHEYSADNSGETQARICTLQATPRISARIFDSDFFQVAREPGSVDDAGAELDAFFLAKVESASFVRLEEGRRICGLLCLGTSTQRNGYTEPFVGAFCGRVRMAANWLAQGMARRSRHTAASLAQEIRPVVLNEQFRLALECFPGAAVVTDGEEKIVLQNSHATEIFGYGPDELVGESISKIVRRQVRQSCAEGYEVVFPEPGSGVADAAPELQGVPKDGVGIQIELTRSTIRVNSETFALNAIRAVPGFQEPEKNLIAMNLGFIDVPEPLGDFKQRIERKTLHVQSQAQVERKHLDVIGQSEAILQVLMNAELVAATDSAVLLFGETGTGKELIARAIHRSSKRADRTMVNVNCAALPATLIESELFGRERGAYTGALTREAGRFELADRSTLFLDEIGELPLELQAKLLRVLEDGGFERLGSSKTHHVNVRVIAATSRDLEAAVREGTFREDLYYRLNVFPMRVPPLRERREDIPMLTCHFLRQLGERMGRDIEAVRAGTMKAFQSYGWPGNVRELRNVIERNLIVHPGRVFEAELPANTYLSPATIGSTIEEVERRHITKELERSNWRVRGVGGAAEALGLKPTTLEARMKKLGIVRT